VANEQDMLVCEKGVGCSGPLQSRIRRNSVGNWGLEWPTLIRQQQCGVHERRCEYINLWEGGEEREGKGRGVHVK
jgi:hypothetical protein